MPELVRRPLNLGQLEQLGERFAPWGGAVFGVTLTCPGLTAAKADVQESLAILSVRVSERRSNVRPTL